MSVVKIEVRLDSNGAVQGVKQLGGEIERLPQSASKAASGMREFQNASERGRQGMIEAQHATELLANQIGLHLPRAVAKFVSESKVLGSVMSGVFNFSIYLAAGTALIGLVGNIGEKLGWWGKQSEEAKKQQDELNKSVEEGIKQLDEYNERIDNLQRARGLIGREGSSKSKVELGQIREDFSRAETAYYQQSGAYNRAYMRSQDKVRFGGGPTPEALEILKNWENIENELIAAEQKYNLAKEKLRNAELQNEYEKIQESKKLQEELKKSMQLYDPNSPQAKAMRFGLEQQNQFNKGLSAAPFSGLSPEAIAAGNAMVTKASDADWKDFYESRDKDVQGLYKSNIDLAINQLKNKKDYLGVQALELQQLDQLKKQYADNADALEMIEERKRLLVMQTNADIAKDSEEKFNRTASAIEGMFNRVFSNVRSFSDFWKQAWSQMANYAVSSVAKLVAAWWTGQKSMSQASASGGGFYGGGGSGGMTQGVQSVMQFASAAPAMGGMMAGGSGQPLFAEMGQAESWGTIGSSGTGAIGSGFSIGSFLSSPAGLSTAAMGGLALANYGVSRGNPWLAGAAGFLGGGLGGLAIGGMLMGHGAMLAGALAGPIGALAGLGIGIFMASRKRGQQKNQSARLVEAYNAAQKKIVDAYMGHKETYDQATGALDSVYQNSVSSLGSMGTPGQNSISAITRGYEDTMQYLQNIELRREGRIKTMSGLPIPEFAGGSNGIIRASSGGFLAVLHPNESVLNQKASAALGDSTIKALNSGQSGSTGKVELHIHAVDANSFVRLMKNSRGAFLEMIRQAARDSGLPYPV